jgi:hypothetical protein
MHICRVVVPYLLLLACFVASVSLRGAEMTNEWSAILQVQFLPGMPHLINCSCSG